ncbi:Rho GTPase effector BNI1 and related formins [Plasmopara halstedii]|uniref:Rho GTPase effector BNI1 and related formins n=1 Tax=Plasmopara halstedii TaxID=4781 RepID=A0A0N7L735_PLAHL|nr:Rho GTPase effector BNI1 and related formins [Plasmopara halstedii]CEG45971.1 Rho GTPase effector BNI1 and related formins [Plasmopara halstedii]|eukprot:XP_024582340.1 Rho GTPase effector BNI1 and related formins [Plasmopara halstedii]
MGGSNSSEGVHLRFLDKRLEIPQAPVTDYVQMRFDELLLIASTNTEFRDELNSAESIENKWAYVYLSNLSDEKVTESWLDPRDYVELLQRYRNSEKYAHDLFLAIRVNILIRPRMWVEKFIEESGVEELVAPLQTRGCTSNDACNNIITTLFVVANSSAAFQALMKISQCCPMLYSVFRTTSSNIVKIRVLKLLGMFCRDGTMAHDAVLSIFALHRSEGMSLQSLFLGPQQNHSDVGLRLATLKFVNILLDTTRDKKTRAEMCQDLKINGIFAFLKPYHSHKDDNELITTSLEAQVTLFRKNYDEVVGGDNPEPLQLSLGDGLHSSDTVRKTDLTSNQGENDDVSIFARPEMEELVDKSTTFSAIDENGCIETDNRMPIVVSSEHASSLDDILEQLHQRTKTLDRSSNEKLVTILQKLVVSLSDESQASKSVHRLVPSLFSDESKEPTIDVKTESEPDFLTRVSMTLFPSFNEPSTSIVKPPTSGRPSFFSGFGDFSIPSLISLTPAKSSVSRPSLSSFLGADSAIRSTDQTSARNAKLTLPLFQSTGNRPGVGITPACTPVATASVRKDAKRPVFPSFLPENDMHPASSLANDYSAAAPLDPVADLPLASNLPLFGNAAAKSSVTVTKSLAIKPNSMSNDTTPDTSDFKGDVVEPQELLPMGAPRAADGLKMEHVNLSSDFLKGQHGRSPKASRELVPSKVITLDMSEAPEASFEDDMAKFESKSTSTLAGPSVASVRTNDHPSALSSPQKSPTCPDITTYVEGDIQKSFFSTPLAGRFPSRTSSKLRVKDDRVYAKFFKLLSMGAPIAAVKAKMAQAGLNSNLLDTPDADVPNDAFRTSLQAKDRSSHATLSTAHASHAKSRSEYYIRVKDEPQYAKFFKLLSMGAPYDSVKAKMQMAGLQPELLDTPEATFKSATDVPLSQPLLKVKDDPSYTKFFKLLEMGAPVESVKAKMQMAGLKPDLLDTPDASVPNEDIKSAGLARVKVKDDPEYTKFFKLLAMGAPVESVKAKMRMAGLKEEFLDTPDAFLPIRTPVVQTASPPPMTTAARRAHLSIAIKPALMAKTRAFYWQHLNANAIKGTIWEELDKEHSNQTNQDFVKLTESDLKVLETEFPPPAACGPGTGTRRGVGSGFLSPDSPASPLASPKIVFLIDRARSNNISIIIKQFKMSNAALRMAIMRMDSEVLTLDRVHGLTKMLPTEDEIVSISGFTGDPSTLNGAELVLKELITVPRLKQRLSALETKHQFPALVRDLRTKINKIRIASHDVAQSTELKAILLVILQVGNKMNHDTARGGAKGFRLNDLTKLVQLKSVDKSITLLHYVARMVRLKRSDVSRLGDSLASLYDVQSISISELQGDMNKINDISESINVELAAQRLKNRIEQKEESDLFVETMSSFVDEALQEVATLRTELDKTLRLVQYTILRFDKSENEEVAALNVPITSATLLGASEFFSIIYEFTISLIKADRENESKRIREEKRLKQQELKCATPRKSSNDRMKFTGKTGSEISGNFRQKSIPATPNIVISQTTDALLSTSGSLNNLSTATSRVALVPILTKDILSTANKMNVDVSVIAETVVEEKVGLRCAKSSTSEPKFAKALLKPPALHTVPTSPLKKIIGGLPTGIPSPSSTKRINSSATSAEKKSASSRSAVPFDAASLSKIKSQLKTRKGTNDEPQMLRKWKPDVIVDGDEHENNNSEPSSPERALTEVRPILVSVHRKS